MIVCEVTKWLMDMRTEPTTNPPRGGMLIFDITEVKDINISGKVYLQTGTFISDFTGTCRTVQQNHLNIMMFEFAWGAANIVLAGTAFAVPDMPNKFVGRFRATARAVEAIEQADTKLLGGPPDPGDTGTGNGTQT